MLCLSSRDSRMVYHTEMLQRLVTFPDTFVQAAARSRQRQWGAAWRPHRSCLESLSKMKTEGAWARARSCHSPHDLLGHHVPSPEVTTHAAMYSRVSFKTSGVLWPPPCFPGHIYYPLGNLCWANVHPHPRVETSFPSAAQASPVPLGLW